MSLGGSILLPDVLLHISHAVSVVLVAGERPSVPVNIAWGVCTSSALCNTADLEFLIASVYPLV